jgi:hypothetical protein
MTLAEGGRVDASESEHARTCARCAAEVSSLAAVVADLRAAEVPEPSPLFWEHLSERISAAVAREAREPGAIRVATSDRHVARRLGWRWWLTAASLASVVLALLVTVGSMPTTRFDARTGGDATGSVTENDTAPADAWQVVVDVASTVDEVTASDELPELAPAAADRAVLDLTPEERAVLVQLLHEEMAGAAL